MYRFSPALQPQKRRCSDQHQPAESSAQTKPRAETPAARTSHRRRPTLSARRTGPLRLRAASTGPEEESRKAQTVPEGLKHQIRPPRRTAGLTVRRKTLRVAILCYFPTKRLYAHDPGFLNRAASCYWAAVWWGSQDTPPFAGERESKAVATQSLKGLSFGGRPFFFLVVNAVHSTTQHGRSLPSRCLHQTKPRNRGGN